MNTKGCLTPGATPTKKTDVNQVINIMMGNVKVKRGKVTRTTLQPSNEDLDAHYRKQWAKAVHPHVKLTPKLKRAVAYMLRLSLTAGLGVTKQAQRQDKALRDVAHSLKRSPVVRAYLGIK